MKRNESSRRAVKKVVVKCEKKEPVYSDYREEIRKRFQRSRANKYYKFPVLPTNSSHKQDPSWSYLSPITTYDLHTQNVQRQNRRKKPLRRARMALPKLSKNTQLSTSNVSPAKNRPKTTKPSILSYSYRISHISKKIPRDLSLKHVRPQKIVKEQRKPTRNRRNKQENEI